MKTFDDLQSWTQFRKTSFVANETVGFVPTMGALHVGHAALLERARRECDKVVLSIFVNPTQFNNPQDLATYPSTLPSDLELAQNLGVDFVLLPKHDQIYPDDYRYKVTEGDLSRELCGAHRPGHFDGVLTVVMRLFNLVRPHKAYFGEKDYQQLLLIKGMVDAFFMDIEIVNCPTVRESDGLAMSSRNSQLTASSRERAPRFHSILQRRELSAEQARLELERNGFKVDYVVDRKSRRLGAVTLGEVRLIDNVE